MNGKTKQKYSEECGKIEENCTYTAEAHHTIALHNKSLTTYFQIVPAVTAAILGVLVGGNIIPDWYIWLSVVAAVISAVGNVLNPMKEYYDHLNAAKNFTTMKRDANALCHTFVNRMTDEEFAIAVESLHSRYNDLVRFAPPTDNDSFEKARRRVQSGIHKSDAFDQ